MTVNMNRELIEKALNRGVENIYPTKADLEKVLLSEKKIKIYHGIDPSGPCLHLGHLIQLRKLSQFQELGHKIILLIGDFTGMIGDPTDKSAARKQLTREQVLENCKNYKEQASKFLKFSGKNPAEIKFNSEWLDKLTFRDIIELAANFTVQRMLERDMFEKRMKEGKPIHLHEFLYPLMQGYDSVALDVDLETGGNDQTFNMLAGRDLLKTLKNKEKFVLTTKLLADPTGKKMGKSEGNMITLVDAPKDIYGKIMSWPDEMIESGFEILTDIPMEEINDMARQMKHNDDYLKINPRDFKMKLAFEIVKVLTDEKSALEAQDYFVKTFQQKETPSEIPEITLDKNEYNVLELLTVAGLSASKGEARRNIEQGGVKIDNQLVKDIDQKIILSKKGIVLQKGKRHFRKVKR